MINVFANNWKNKKWSQKRGGTLRNMTEPEMVTKIHLYTVAEYDIVNKLITVNKLYHKLDAKFESCNLQRTNGNSYGKKSLKFTPSYNLKVVGSWSTYKF